MDNDVLKTVSDRRSHRAYEKRQLSEDVLSAILKRILSQWSIRWQRKKKKRRDGAFVTERGETAESVLPERVQSVRNYGYGF